MDVDIESVVKECIGCLENSNKLNITEYSSWIEPTQPLQRVHIEFVGNNHIWVKYFGNYGCQFKMDGSNSYARNYDRIYF